MKNFGIILFLIIVSGAFYAQQKNKLAILGTYHFHLVKPQFGIDYSITDKEKQAVLNAIAAQIAL